jgi:hypothetical protein
MQAKGSNPSTPLEFGVGVFPEPQLPFIIEIHRFHPSVDGLAIFLPFGG